MRSKVFGDCRKSRPNQAYTTLAAENERTWAIELKHSGDLSGLTSCSRQVAHSVEVGY